MLVAGPAVAQSLGPVAGDNAYQINAAIAAAHNAGGGMVALSAGQYELDHQVYVEQHVHLVCADNGFDAGGHAGNPNTSAGTMFNVKWGNGPGASNDFTKAAIILNKSSIENCGFTYPLQDPAASSPVEYGASILAVDGGSSAIHNFCSNCYSFLDFRGSISGLYLYNVTSERNWGAPLAFGLRIDAIGDWSLFDRNIFHVGWFDFGDVATNHLPWWSYTNGVAFEVGNTDWVNLADEQVVGYLFGLKLVFNDAAFGAGHRGPLDLSHAQFDACLYACIGATGGGTIMNLRVTDGSFTAYNIFTQQPSGSSGGLVLYDDYLTIIQSLQFANNYVFGPTNYLVYTDQAKDVEITGNHGTTTSPFAAGQPALVLNGASNLSQHDNLLHGWEIVQ